MTTINHEWEIAQLDRIIESYAAMIKDWEIKAVMAKLQGTVSQRESMVLNARAHLEQLKYKRQKLIQQCPQAYIRNHIDDTANS